MKHLIRGWSTVCALIPTFTTQRLIPGLAVIAVILAARSLGMLEPFELVILDSFLKLRPIESSDQRITLVKIRAQDIEKWDGYPMATQEIISLIEQLQSHGPKVIGLNFLEDLLGHNAQALTHLFDKYENLVIAEKVLPPQILAPIQINSDQIGFVDVKPDRDNILRRTILGTPNPFNNEDEFKFSFSIQLAQKYLSHQERVLTNSSENEDVMRFEHSANKLDYIDIPLIEENFGGYAGIDAGGIQTLINFRQNLHPFSSIHVQSLTAKQPISHLIKDRIVIIGVTDPVARPYIQSNTLAASNSNIAGLEVQAHITSQIISAALDKRQLLNSPPLSTQNKVFFLCAFLGMVLPLNLKNIKFDILKIGLSILANVVLSYGLLLNGIWITCVPQILFLSVSSASSLIIMRLQEDQHQISDEINKKITVKKRLDERRKIIERTFLIIHNVPLQMLSSLIRDCQDRGKIEAPSLVEKLKKLDLEIRKIGDFLRSDNSDFIHQFYLENNERLDLRLPMHEIFYQLFQKTINRDLVGFKKLKVKVRSFDPIYDDLLTLDRKRELCRFLEGMLCNVEKHAQEASKLVVRGELDGSTYRLMIEDNGISRENQEKKNLIHQGEGTKHAYELAYELNGKFSQTTYSDKGNLSILTWKIMQP